VRRELGLASYTGRRILQAVPLVLVITVINFLLIHLAPGDPVSYLAGQYQATPEYQEVLRRQFGLDQPLHIQFVRYLSETLQGNFGYSLRSQQSVLSLILERLPATLILMGSAFLTASVLGVLLGVVASRHPYSLGDNVATFLALAGYSMPVFWLGQVLLIVLAVQLDLFPAGGMYSLRAPSEGVGRVLDVAHHLVLPALTYGVYHLTLVFRLTRTKMEETLLLDFITTARAKGVSERGVVYRHALRNAIMPVVTVMGVNFGFMLAGSVLTETVFGWPGIGRLMYDAILARDYPVLMGIFALVSVMVIVTNLLVDFVYALVDPRVVYS